MMKNKDTRVTHIKFRAQCSNPWDQQINSDLSKSTHADGSKEIIGKGELRAQLPVELRRKKSRMFSIA